MGKSEPGLVGEFGSGGRWVTTAECDRDLNVNCSFAEEGPCLRHIAGFGKRERAEFTLVTEEGVSAAQVA